MPPWTQLEDELAEEERVLVPHQTNTRMEGLTGVHDIKRLMPPFFFHFHSPFVTNYKQRAEQEWFLTTQVEPNLKAIQEALIVRASFMTRRERHNLLLTLF